MKTTRLLISLFTLGIVQLGLTQSTRQIEDLIRKKDTLKARFQTESLKKEQSHSAPRLRAWIALVDEDYSGALQILKEMFVADGKLVVSDAEANLRELAWLYFLAVARGDKPLSGLVLPKLLKSKILDSVDDTKFVDVSSCTSQVSAQVLMLLANKEIGSNPYRARYYAESAQSIDPKCVWNKSLVVSLGMFPGADTSKSVQEQKYSRFALLNIRKLGFVTKKSNKLRQ
jgi:hypothetical protein